jgi:hypothetical protein
MPTTYVSVPPFVKIALFRQRMRVLAPGMAWRRPRARRHARLHMRSRRSFR